MAGADLTNLVSIGRPSQPDVAYAQTAWTVWRTANPLATPAQAETALQAAITAALANATVQVAVHVFALTPPQIGVLIADLSESIPAQWWTLSL